MVFISITASIIAYTILLQKTSVKIQTNMNTTTYKHTNRRSERTGKRYKKERLDKYNQQLKQKNILNTQETS